MNNGSLLENLVKKQQDKKNKILLKSIKGRKTKSSSIEPKLINSWHKKIEKRQVDELHFHYLAPLIRFNQEMGAVTAGISLPSEMWIWEQTLASKFKLGGAKFRVFGAENSSDKDVVYNFLNSSHKINNKVSSNLSTSPHVGNIMDLICGDHEIKELHKLKEVDFIYADFTGNWAKPIVDFCVALFKDQFILKKNGLFLITISLARGSKDKDIREQTIEIGKNMSNFASRCNFFEVFDSNFLCRKEKAELGKMSNDIPDLVRGIAAFIWRQAEKAGISVKVHNPHIYYNEYTLPNGWLKRNPMASLYFSVQ